MDLLGILRIKDSNGNWVSVPGLKGDTGEPFKILGIYATAAALEAAVTDPEVGDVYLVGTTGAYDIYLYLTDGWHNTGRYMPKGDTGDPAPQEAITAAVETWLGANVDPETGYVLDRTLAQENAAAPADLVGNLKSNIQQTTGNSEIQLVSGYINTDNATIDVTAIVPHAHYYTAAVPCAAGDRFTINAAGGSSPRSFAFADANGNSIFASRPSPAVSNLLVSAPENSAYLIINDYDGIHKSYTGWVVDSQLDIVDGGLFGSENFSFNLRAGWNYIYYSLLKGVTYRFLNNLTGSLSIAFIKSNGSTSEITPINAGAYLDFYADDNYVGFQIYANAAGTASISILPITSSIERDVSAVTEQISDIGYEQIKDIASSAGMTVSDSGISRGTGGTFSLTISKEKMLPIIVRAKTTYTEAPPYININGDNIYNNIRMELYDNKIGGISELRIPPLDCGFNTKYDITIALPVGATIKYLEFSKEKTLQRRSTYDGICINSHLGFDAVAPENTMPAFLAAYRSGYDAIICNPKLTSDGVWVCCHDNAINRTARNADGTEITSTVNISDTTYSDLLSYDFGIAFNAAFVGTKIPKLDDFLKLCATTGIRPIFSIHENNPSTEYVTSLYNLVYKWGLIPKLVLKINASSYTAWHNVFGKIWMYDFVVSTEAGVTSAISDVKALSEYGQERFMIDVPINIITSTIANSIISENILCGVYDLQQTLFSKYKNMAEYGVTQFTDDRYPLTGLNWN